MRSFEIVRPLGTGGMASVHLAQGEDGRLFAIKQLHSFLEGDEAARDQLREEARLASAVDHPNVVRVFGVVEHEGDSMIAMEWIDGRDLATFRGESVSLESVVAIMRDVLEGLAAVHEATDEEGAPLDIVHGDVSPQNVIVGHDGVARLGDFGLARSSVIPPAEPATVSGTLGYMAPEQLEGRADRRSDLFAAGVVLWELITGMTFRSSTNGVEAFVEILCNHVVPPSAHRPEAAALDAMVLRALAHAPEDRFQTAREMLEALASCVVPSSDVIEAIAA